jgi:hypothetical protein
MMFEWSKDEVQAIKTCVSTDEGRRALGFIVQRLCGITTSSFSTDASHMAFKEGVRWVGIQINDAIMIPTDKLVKEPHEPRSNRPVTFTERAERAAAGEPTHKLR